MGTITLKDSAHAIWRAFCYESGPLCNRTHKHRVDAACCLVFAASMRAGNHRIFPQVNRPRRTGYVCIVALPCLTSNDMATSRFVMLSVLLPLADSHLYVYMHSLVCR